MIIMEEWQKQRLDFYQNSGALEFIKNYFNVKKGVRCIAGHYKEYPKRGRCQYEYQNNKTRMITIPHIDTKKYTSLIDFNCVHSFMRTFDKSVLEWMDIKTYLHFIRTSSVGINAILEIDTPYISIEEKSPRVDFFECTNDINNTINTIDKKLEEIGENYNMLFSGNGLYIILEGYYEDNFLEYKDNFINLFENLQKDGFGNPLKIHIDNKLAPWNDYMKIPFTFHERKPRITVPLPKGDIDVEWLKRVSNINNIMNDYSIISEIIKKANWVKLW